MPLKDRYQSEKWKEYQRTYHRGWHQRNREKRLARMYERKAAIYQYVQNMKSQLSCVDCGQRHPATLQFHHLNSENKTFTIGDAVTRGFSLDRIKKEISKCIVLCANCHFKRHYNMRSQGQLSPGIAGELDALNTSLAISSEEEDTYNKQFGVGKDNEQ